MIIYSLGVHAHPDASVSSLESFRRQMLSYLTNRLLPPQTEGQARCSLIVYLSFRLPNVGTLDDSLKFFRTYTRLHCQAHRAQRHLQMYAVALILRVRRNTAHSMKLVQFL